MPAVSVGERTRVVVDRPSAGLVVAERLLALGVHGRGVLDARRRVEPAEPVEHL